MENNINPHDKYEMDIMYNKMSDVWDQWLMFATVRALYMKESTAGIEAGKALQNKLST